MNFVCTLVLRLVKYFLLMKMSLRYTGKAYKHDNLDNVLDVGFIAGGRIFSFIL